MGLEMDDCHSHDHHSVANLGGSRGADVAERGDDDAWGDRFDGSIRSVVHCPEAASGHSRGDFHTRDCSSPALKEWGLGDNSRLEVDQAHYLALASYLDKG